MKCTWRTPLGFVGICLSTVFITLTVLGLIGHLSGLLSNRYVSIFTFVFFPVMMLFGLALIPLSCLFRRKKWFKTSFINPEHLKIDLTDSQHRKGIFVFLVLTVINATVLMLVVYEGYNFTDSSYFCGVVCHQVMDPEYTAYQRSPHAKVPCVSCHIGPDAGWYVQSKLSGLKQIKSIFTGDFNRPIHTMTKELRPSRDTCESCHWPEKFHGKRVKKFIRFTNDNLSSPIIQEITLRTGGRNPVNGAFEGIHWHISQDVKVEYQALDEEHTTITRVRVTKPDGIVEEYSSEDALPAQTIAPEWRTMDCIDCHNRPTHVFDDLERVVDFGLYSKKISPFIPGIREDSIAILQKKYASRDQAAEQITTDLVKRVARRHGEDFTVRHEKELLRSGSFLLVAYLNNVWPEMRVSWGTYRQHIGHKNAAEGYGCFRCHDNKHISKSGKVIGQSCTLCHDQP
jgi:nitrate/TMAO reductase-like tetraheme cytochrome c subunit